MQETVVSIHDSKQLLSLYSTCRQWWSIIKLEETDFFKVQYSSHYVTWSFLTKSPSEILQMAEGPWIDKLKESIFWKNFLENKSA